MLGLSPRNTALHLIHHDQLRLSCGVGKPHRKNICHEGSCLSPLAYHEASTVDIFHTSSRTPVQVVRSTFLNLLVELG